MYQREQSDNSCRDKRRSSNKNVKSIAESIAPLEKEVKASKLDVIIPRNDNWNNKVMEVNSYLRDLRESNDIPFINNTTINPKKHSLEPFTLEPKRLQQTS